ncbi:hypothetical protein NQ314_004066 [Rhamnusium bicolor]|uniref:Uncharacterized protein n=1 Tax=Rhamnusium bicolor TaxID=1586634 RepID=A0AAV8ZNQ1_9CUCU|nr:hypothetical protein NQ314_004066 [Rhamnusium bicolor]
MCENYFYIVKKYLVFPRNIYVQVGAFYLLYGVYYKQPLKNWVKIRLTLDEYKAISELITEMKARQQNDAVYVFAKMQKDQVFLYTALRKPLGPEDRFVKSFELYYTFHSYQTESALSKFNQILPNSEIIQGLEKTNKEYQECLRKYAEKCPSLAHFASTIVDDLNGAYSKVQMGVSSLKNKEQI